MYTMKRLMRTQIASIQCVGIKRDVDIRQDVTRISK